MSMIRRGGRTVGAAFLLGLAGASSSPGQGLPDPLPPIPASALAVAPAPVPAEVRPMPPVVFVPPGGMQPTWGLPPVDPVATAVHEPKRVEKKSGSWHWRRLQGKILGYPEDFTPRPLGAALYDHGRIMVANGASARMTLYHYDFVDGSAQLTPRGLDQVAKLGPQLAASPYPLIVERTQADPALAASRRYAVLAALARSPYPVSSDRVLVGVPAANGLSGRDAQLIDANAMSRTLGYGPPIPINAIGVNSPSGVTINSPSVGP